MCARSWLVLLCLAFAACSDSRSETVDEPSPADRVFGGANVAGDTWVTRDHFGIAHVRAENPRDLGYGQGYVTAHDRLIQMDVLRRLGAGELAELFGIRREVIESDIEMRMHRFRAVAEATWETLQMSRDPSDREITQLLEGYADGINAYAAALVDGDEAMDPIVGLTFKPDLFRPWHPVDSLIVGRFQAYALSYTANSEIRLTNLYREARDVFDLSPRPGEEGHDEARHARRGAAADLIQVAPAADVATQTMPALASVAPPRPMALADGFLEVDPRIRQRDRRRGPLHHEGFLEENGGSNTWAVAPQHTTSGSPLLAGDQHLSLGNPSTFYPIHLEVPDKWQVAGVTFPGIPGVILGHNGKLAWNSTVVYHDVNDVYVERILPCSQGVGDCTLFNGAEVPLETWEESIDIGFLGAITRTDTVRYERVPHHGPLIPTIQNGTAIPRVGNRGLSVRYTGHTPTYEIRALYKLAQAQTVRDGMQALLDFEVGAQNFVLMDTLGEIGWSTHARVPARPAEALTWHASDNPDGLAPFFVLPGDGTAEWQGDVASERLPQTVSPTRGFIVTANSDPWGTTFDGDPLNEARAEALPYLGANYAPGFRTHRITHRLTTHIEAGEAHSTESLRDIQLDPHSPVGSRVAPHLVQARQTEQADATAFLATLSAEQLARLDAAVALLATWSHRAPGTTTESPDASAATIFNVWVHFFLGRAFEDEYAAVAYSVRSVGSDRSARLLVRLFQSPDSLLSGLHPETSQPVLCDDMRTTASESCDHMALLALHDAVSWLGSPDGHGSQDPEQWAWGKVHTLTLHPLIPTPELTVPRSDDATLEWRNGFPTPGDQFSVPANNGGYADLRFTHTSGAAQRFVADVQDGQIRASMALPGGVVFAEESPYYRNLADEYYAVGEMFQLPFTSEEVKGAQAELWLFASE